MGHLVATGAESGLAKSVLTQMILPSRQRLRGDAAAADRPIDIRCTGRQGQWPAKEAQ